MGRRARKAQSYMHMLRAASRSPSRASQTSIEHPAPHQAGQRRGDHTDRGGQNSKARPPTAAPTTTTRRLPPREDKVADEQPADTQTYSTDSLATRTRGIRYAHGARCASGLRCAQTTRRRTKPADTQTHNETRRQKQATTRSRRDAPSARSRSQARAPACSSPLPPWAELSSREHDRRRARADKARSAFAFSLKATRRPRRFSAAAAAAAPTPAETIATNAEIAYAYPPSVRETVPWGSGADCVPGGSAPRLLSKSSPHSMAFRAPRTPSWHMRRHAISIAGSLSIPRRGGTDSDLG